MRLVLCAFAFLSYTVAFAQAQPSITTRQSGTATLENVPAIPAEVTASVQRYAGYRQAAFQDWLADGSMLITTRFGASRQLHRVVAPGGARTQLTFFPEPVAGAVAIPGANRFVLSRDTGGDEWFQLYTMGLAGSPRRITEAGTRNQSAVVSKDGKLIAWSRAVKGSADYTIYVADPADPGSAKVAWQAQGAVFTQDISADKTTALLSHAISNRESELLLLDLSSGKVRQVPGQTERALYSDPHFGPDDRSVLTISDRGSDVRRLIEIDLTSGKVTVVTPDLKWDVEGFAVSGDDSVLAYTYNEDGYSRLVLVDLRTRRALPQPQLPGGVLSSMGFSPDSASLAFTLTAASSAGDVWTWAVQGGLTRWTTSELGGLDPQELIEPTLVRFESFDRQSVPAFVYRPKSVAEDVRTPVIVDIHGGPESQTRPGWTPLAQYFAATLGATVIQPNVRGSDGYGKRYLNLDNADKREDSVKDIGALLDWIARQPNLDASRVAVYGQSYGGYMSLAVMTHYASRLVGGVERYGISDWVSFLQNTESYRRDNRRAEYGDERDPRMLAVFKRISPLANVRKITKPMLVMQGANDPRVPKRESDQVVAGIRANGIDAWYVVFADEGHGFQKKPNNDLRMEVETVFLAKLFGARIELAAAGE